MATSLVSPSLLSFTLSPTPTPSEGVPSPLLCAPRKADKTTWLPLGCCTKKSLSRASKISGVWRWGFLGLRTRRLHNGRLGMKPDPLWWHTKNSNRSRRCWRQLFLWRSRWPQVCQEEVLAFSVKGLSSCFISSNCSSSFQDWAMKKEMAINQEGNSKNAFILSYLVLWQLHLSPAGLSRPGKTLVHGLQVGQWGTWAQEGPGNCL